MRNTVAILPLFLLAASPNIPNRPPQTRTQNVRQERVERVATISEDRENRRAELQERLEENRAEREQRKRQLLQRIEEKRATRQAQLTQTRQDRIEMFWQRMMRRIQATINRIEILIERIESRIDKIEANNEDIDTSEVVLKIEEAKTLLADAETDLEAADAGMERVLASDDPKAAFQVVRETVHEIKSDLMEVHRLLVSVIGDIRGLRVGGSTRRQTRAEEPETTSGPTVAEPTPTQEIAPTTSI